MSENTNKTLGETIKDVLLERGLNLSTVAKKMNVTRTVVSQINKRKNFDIEFLSRLEEATGIDLAKYVQVPDYMMKALESNKSDLHDDESKYDIDISTKGWIKVFDIEGSAGPQVMFNDSAEIAAAKMFIPAFSDCDFAIVISGKSMQPEYNSGDLIICKKLNNYNVIPLGEVYLIITDEQRLVKRITKHDDKDFFMLTSFNEAFDPFPIHKSEIKHLYQVKGKIERHQI